MKHTKGDCPEADPNSDELCKACHKCPEEDCIRPIGHTGFHFSEEPTTPTPPTEKCYLMYDDSPGYLVCSYNHEIGEECLMDDKDNDYETKCTRCGLRRSEWKGRWQKPLCRVGETTYDTHHE